MIAKSWETDPGKSAFAEVLKVKNVKYPDPNVIHPIVGYDKEIYPMLGKHFWHKRCWRDTSFHICQLTI